MTTIAILFGLPFMMKQKAQEIEFPHLNQTLFWYMVGIVILLIESGAANTMILPNLVAISWSPGA